MYFKNKDNDYIEKSSLPWLWCLLFGWMYFAYKGAIAWAFLWMLCVFASFGIAAFVFPFVAKEIVRKSYLKKGWVQVDNH